MRKAARCPPAHRFRQAPDGRDTRGAVLPAPWRGGRDLVMARRPAVRAAFIVAGYYVALLTIFGGLALLVTFFGPAD